MSYFHNSIRVAVAASLALSGNLSAWADPQIIAIDNDQPAVVANSITDVSLPTDESGTIAKAGAKFPVVLASELSSKTVKVGDPITAKLKCNIKIGGKVIAEKGATVVGHVAYAMPARTQLRSVLSKNRCSMTSGCVGLKFDEIVTSREEHLALQAEPSATATFIENRNEGRVLGINQKGEIAGPYSMQLKNLALRAGVSAAMAPLGPLSFGAVPVTLGVIGAINPGFAFGKPVGYNVRHRRVKGFFLGALYGVPGGFLLQGGAVKGEEVVLKPGDEFSAELRQEFTGLPSSEAELMARADTKVRGEIIKTNSLTQTN